MSDEEILVAGRYRLGARIGSGAMGVVWQAHDERLHRTVAVKQLLSQPGLSEDQAEEARQRAMREGRIAARLSHPNAITVYDVAEHDAEPWLIMEYLPSKSLATVLSERDTLAPVEAARIGSQIAAALVAAHAAGIVHRDIKPANVLLGEDGTVKITDFGISRATGDITVTATGMLAGTPAYLAPEVAKGEQPTSAADVFSLGSTLYTTVEGHSPFGLSENTLALLYAVAAGKVQPPRQAGPLTALLMQLLRADPTERPTMSAAREALAAVAAGKPLPSIALANQRTDPYRKPQLGPNQQQTPPPGIPHASGTRLDVNPFAELQQQPAQQQQPQQMRAEPQQRPPMGSGPRKPPAAARPPAPTKKRDVRSIMLTVLAIIGAALVGVLVASILTNNDPPRASNTSTAPPVPTSKPKPTTTTASTAATTTTSETTTTTTTTTTTSATPTAQDYEQALRAYYALLPGNPAAAWAMLTDRAQKKSKGYDSFKKFYDDLDKVELLSATANGKRIEGQVRFTRSGLTTTERYLWVMDDVDGTIKMDNYDSRGLVLNSGNG
jgi:serine/threonine protein kinase